MRKFTVYEKEKGVFSIDATSLIHPIFYDVTYAEFITPKTEYKDDDERDEKMVYAVGQYQDFKKGFEESGKFIIGNNTLLLRIGSKNVEISAKS